MVKPKAYFGKGSAGATALNSRGTIVSATATATAI